MKNYNKEFILNVCNSLINYQDKFIVYGLYQGLKGDDYADLLEIKLADISEDYSYINLKNRKFICDDFMARMLKGTVKSKMYFINNNNLHNEDHYYFNDKSEYLIKSIPTSTDNGLSPMSKNQLEIKLNEIKKSFDEVLNSTI